MPAVVPAGPGIRPAGRGVPAGETVRLHVASRAMPRASTHRRVRNPIDRGKKGSKIHLIAERTGLPISIGISAANMHDSQGLEPLVRGIPPIRSRRGPRRRRPAKPNADKGTTPTISDSGCARGTSHRASPARASNPPSDRGATPGPWSARWRGWPGAAACIAATSARPRTSWPSPASPRP